MRSDKGYTDAIGNELKIIGNASLFNKAAGKPLMNVGRNGNSIVIKFVKDQSDGIHIYCRRGAEKEFSFLAVDTSSPYLDNRPNLIAGQSETREYKAWYFIDDTLIGQPSDVAMINA